MHRPITLISEAAGFSPRALDRIQPLCTVVVADLDRPGLLEAVREAEVLWVRLRHRIDREVFEVAPRLRAVLSATTGLNHIDLELASARGVRVISLRGEVEFLREIRATAELTLGLILSLVRRIPKAVRHTLDGGWSRDLFKGRELFGKTAGIVGYGRVGSQVGQYLTALGMKVIASDPNITSADVSLLPLHELLAIADVVTLHVSLDERSSGMFAAREFSAMKKGAWFVNTSRGELVDETALLDALAAGHLAGAALDVLRREDSAGMNSHPLIQYAMSNPELLITPHIGGCTLESMEKCEHFLAERLADWLRDHGTAERNGS